MRDLRRRTKRARAAAAGGFEAAGQNCAFGETAERYKRQDTAHGTERIRDSGGAVRRRNPRLALRGSCEPWPRVLISALCAERKYEKSTKENNYECKVPRVVDFTFCYRPVRRAECDPSAIRGQS